ncbi:MAG: FadR/GntR family transcriptional regulator [Schleiferiaceae bacterium]
MSENRILDNLKEIAIESPVDIIIRQIKDSISKGEIEPGAKLPPERKLAEKFGVGRSYVREAIRKLEFYGVLKTLPQSGTIVAGLGIVALEGLISEVLSITEKDFGSLIETRYFMEVEAARLAAERRTQQDIENLQMSLEDYKREVEKGNQGIDQDLIFHLAIAEASKNPVLKSLMMLITPDILHNYHKKNVCGDGKTRLALEQHQQILQAIIDQDAEAVQLRMKEHLDDILETE